ncbi:MAG: hypothetical protein AB1633_09175 [Elusimicrobiota bacterium]
MKSKYLLTLMVLFLLCISVFATRARVESMGKSDAFFMDDFSIFRNPSNINIYPNFLIGELGTYDEPYNPDFDSTAWMKGMTPQNKDPLHPYYGGIFSYSLNKDKELGSRYPQITIGAIVNKQNELVDTLIDKLNLNKAIVLGNDTTTDIGSKFNPVGLHTDMFIGFTSKKGQMFGLHYFGAFQNDRYEGKEDSAYKTTVMKFDLGTNLPVGRVADLEVNAGVGFLGFNSPNSKSSGFDNSVNFDLRLFSTLEAINGEIVPICGIKAFEIERLEYKYSKIYAGVGINVTLDRGFFWLGMQGVNEKFNDGDDNVFSVPFSFGIERNIIWDWFVWRVGGMKKVMLVRNGSHKYWSSNPEGDGTANDQVSVGWGLNIEEKLKVDGVVAEDIFYTWGNIISGNSHHVLTKITATYSF